MFQISATGSENQNTHQAITECLDGIARELDGAPDYIMIHCNADHDVGVIREAVSSRYPDTSLHGGTSCLGAMTHLGHIGRNGAGLAVFAIADDNGDYGSACVESSDSPQNDAALALDAALIDAGRPGELPALIWVTASPGQEEAIIDGLESIIGPDVPIVGGSSADNTIEGNWSQFNHKGHCTHGVVISVLFPSVRVGTAFRSGYLATDKCAVATKAKGRTIYELNGQPARAVYNEWLNGLLSDLPPDQTTNILGLSTLHPLGRAIGKLGSATVHLLSHPETVTAEGALTLFTEVIEGETLVLMTGTQETIIKRAGRVAESAAKVAEIDRDEISGAIMVYCAGCMLAVRERLDEAVSGINDAVNGTPLIGTFTFGEQGHVLSETNRHGNLMISAVVFGK